MAEREQEEEKLILNTYFYKMAFCASSTSTTLEFCDSLSISSKILFKNGRMKLELCFFARFITNRVILYIIIIPITLHH